MCYSIYRKRKGRVYAGAWTFDSYYRWEFGNWSDWYYLLWDSYSRWNFSNLLDGCVVFQNSEEYW